MNKSGGDNYMKKIKILHVIPSLLPGGAENLVSNLLLFSNRSSYDVAVLKLFDHNLKNYNFKIYSGNHNWEEHLKSSRIKRYWNDIKIMWNVYRIIRDFKPDVIHTHLYTIAFVLLPSILFRVPVRVHTVHTIAQKDAKGIVKLINIIAFKFLGFIPVSISKRVAETVKQVYGIDSPVIYNGIDTQEFSIEISKKSNLSDKRFILINVARFVEEKNQKLLIEAFSKSIQEIPNLELWFVGDGPLRTEIEQLVEQKKLKEKVKFFGVRSDIPKLLSQADIFVLSSDYEGLPLSVLEAMAAGLPVIATAVGGVPEILEGGKAGVLVPPRDADALAKAIVELARDEKKRTELSDYGKKLVAEKFDIRRTVKEYERLYLELLKKNKRSRKEKTWKNL